MSINIKKYVNEMIIQRIKEIENEIKKIDFYIEMNKQIKYVNTPQQNFIKCKVAKSKERIKRLKEIKTALITEIRIK
jgi:hypothetical protein